MWCCSYFSFRPRRIEMVSSTLGSSTKTGWKRRARAASFSTCLRYSSSVVAPTQCSSPRASAGFKQVGGVHGAVGLAGADQRVHLVDEQDDAAGGSLDFGKHGLQPLLELAAILRAGDQRAHVERHQPLVLQRLGHVAIDDAERQALDDRRLADARLADQHRIVLGAPRQHLDGAADLLVAADHRVELARPGIGGEIARIFLQRVVALLGIGRIGGAALAQIVDRLVQRLRRDPGLGQDVGGLAGFLHRQRGQQPLDRDEAVAGLLGHLLGRGEHLGQRLRQIELAIAALDLRQRVEGRLDRQLHRVRVAAGA